MSFYPNEGEPLWSRYSTHAIVHTLEIYSRHTFPYPYPTAISVNGPVGGMEYPMICFNGPRPEDDGTYTKRTKYGLISVIIHEVGHNWFPMIINSDERQWTWMDEGLNTYLQFIAEQEWEKDYPSRRGEPRDIVEYMVSTNQVPIMTNSESILQFGNNAYAKPATALNVLRETIVGRQLFDFAFKQYANRWKFKRPCPPTSSEPSRTPPASTSTGSGEAGSTPPTTPTSPSHASASSSSSPGTPTSTKRASARNATLAPGPSPSDATRASSDGPTASQGSSTSTTPSTTSTSSPPNASPTRTSSTPSSPTNASSSGPTPACTPSTSTTSAASSCPSSSGSSTDDGSSRVLRIPAEIWRKNNQETSKLLITERPIARLTLDPFHETADVDESNNHWPPRPVKTRFELFKRPENPNPMRELLDQPTTDEDPDR
jgi:hypothetical protein